MSTVQVQVVEGTEAGPIFYEISHERDGRSWSVKQRFSALDAMKHVLWRNRLPLPEVRFPPKQAPFVRLANRWQAHQGMAMPAGEMEERRRGLEAYLSALADLKESWESSIVTQVLCVKEDAASATLSPATDNSQPDDDSGAEDNPAATGSSLIVIPKAVSWVDQQAIGAALSVVATASTLTAQHSGLRSPPPVSALKSPPPPQRPVPVVSSGDPSSASAVTPAAGGEAGIAAGATLNSPALEAGQPVSLAQRLREQEQRWKESHALSAADVTAVPTTAPDTAAAAAAAGASQTILLHSATSVRADKEGEEEKEEDEVVREREGASAVSQLGLSSATEEGEVEGENVKASEQLEVRPAPVDEGEEDGANAEAAPGILSSLLLSKPTVAARAAGLLAAELEETSRGLGEAAERAAVGAQAIDPSVADVTAAEQDSNAAEVMEEAAAAAAVAALVSRASTGDAALAPPAEGLALAAEAGKKSAAVLASDAAASAAAAAAVAAEEGAALEESAELEEGGRSRECPPAVPALTLSSAKEDPEKEVGTGANTAPPVALVEGAATMEEEGGTKVSPAGSEVAAAPPQGSGEGADAKDAVASPVPLTTPAKKKRSSLLGRARRSLSGKKVSRDAKKAAATAAAPATAGDDDIVTLPTSIRGVAETSSLSVTVPPGTDNFGATTPRTPGKLASLRNKARSLASGRRLSLGGSGPLSARLGGGRGSRPLSARRSSSGPLSLSSARGGTGTKGIFFSMATRTPEEGDVLGGGAGGGGGVTGGGGREEVVADVAILSPDSFTSADDPLGGGKRSQVATDGVPLSLGVSGGDAAAEAAAAFADPPSPDAA